MDENAMGAKVHITPSVGYLSDREQIFFARTNFASVKKKKKKKNWVQKKKKKKGCLVLFQRKGINLKKNFFFLHLSFREKICQDKCHCTKTGGFSQNSLEVFVEISLP